jgi:hypothetical protein
MLSSLSQAPNTLPNMVAGLPTGTDSHLQESLVGKENGEIRYSVDKISLSLV